MELPQKQSAWRGPALFGDNKGTDTEEGPRTQPPLQSTAIHTELQETSPPPDLCIPLASRVLLLFFRDPCSP